MKRRTAMVHRRTLSGVTGNTFSRPFSRFESVVFPSVTLESTQVARLNATLKVGAVSSSVTVTSNAPVLDQERADVGTNSFPQVCDQGEE